MEPIKNIDNYTENPQDVAPYAVEIYNNLFKREKLYQPNPNYMLEQTEINSRSRTILCVWLYDVSTAFKLLPESYQLGISILDRFSSYHIIDRAIYQLVGMTCLWIASKVEEIYPPESNDFIYMAAGAYKLDEMLDMEDAILNSLDFEIKVPLPIDFQRRFSKAAGLNLLQHQMTKYLIDISLVSYDSLQLLPSELSAGCTYLVLAMYHKEWQDDLVYYTHYSAIKARNYATIVQNIYKSTTVDQVGPITKKYKAVSRENYLIDLPIPTLSATYILPEIPLPKKRKLVKPTYTKNFIQIPEQANSSLIPESYGPSTKQPATYSKLVPIPPKPIYAPSEWD